MILHVFVSTSLRAGIGVGVAYEPDALSAAHVSVYSTVTYACGKHLRIAWNIIYQAYITYALRKSRPVT